MNESTKCLFIYTNRVFGWLVWICLCDALHTETHVLSRPSACVSMCVAVAVRAIE